jgi:DNA-directed RNA polymerase specialized sigma24 family protein
MNRMIMMIRGQQRKQKRSASGAFLQPAEGPDRLFQLTMLRALLLPARSRDVFVLIEMHGYTLLEVARALGMSKEAVKKHLRRAQREVAGV